MYPLEKKYPELVITASNYDRKISMEMSSDSSMEELFEAFKTIALGLTYQSEGWDNYILQLADDIRDARYREEQEQFHRNDYQEDYHPSEYYPEDYQDEVTDH